MLEPVAIGHRMATREVIQAMNNLGWFRGSIARIALAFAEDRDLFHAAHRADFDGELSDHGMPPDEVLDLRGIEVDASHREHIVDAAANAAEHLREGTAAFARGTCDLDAVSGPVA